MDKTGNGWRDQVSVWRDLTVSLILFDFELLTFFDVLPFWWMKPLCGHLVLRWQKLVYMIYLTHYIYCEVLISWSYFGNGYFAYIQTIIWLCIWYQMKKWNKCVSSWQITDGHKYFHTLPIEIWESVCPSLKYWWTLRLLWSLDYGRSDS